LDRRLPDFHSQYRFDREEKTRERPGRQCASPVVRSASAHLQLLASDIEPALLAPGTKDRVFGQYASDLRDALRKWDVGADCAHQSEALTVVANACEACHRDYR
jgi:hypothetical protein